MKGQVGTLGGACTLLYLKQVNNRGFPGVASGKEPTSQCRRRKRCGSDPWIRRIPWRRKQQPTPVFLPGKSHGQRSLAGDGPWGRKELDMTEQLNNNNKNQQRPTTAEHVDLCPMLRGGLNGRGVWGERIRVCERLSLSAVHLKLSHCLLISYTSVQNKKFKKIR